MNCTEFTEEISLYIDNELNDLEIEELEAHLKQCNKCKIEYKSMKMLIDILNDSKEVDLPKDYNKSLRQKLENEKAKQKKFNLKTITSIAAGLVLMITSITFVYQYSLDSNDEISFDTNDMESIEKNSESEIANDEALLDSTENKSMTFTLKEAPEDNNRAIQTTSANQKVITTVKIEGYTDSKEKFNKLILNIENNNGYIESNEKVDSNNNNTTNMKILSRIPSENTENIIDIINQYINVESTSFDDNDITSEYFEVEETILNLKKEVIELENELSKESDNETENELKEIKTEINVYKELLSRYDEMINITNLELNIIINNK